MNVEISPSSWTQRYERQSALAQARYCDACTKALKILTRDVGLQLSLEDVEVIQTPQKNYPAAVSLAMKGTQPEQQYFQGFIAGHLKPNTFIYEDGSLIINNAYHLFEAARTIARQRGAQAGGINLTAEFIGRLKPGSAINA